MRRRKTNKKHKYVVLAWITPGDRDVCQTFGFYSKAKAKSFMKECDKGSWPTDLYVEAK